MNSREDRSGSWKEAVHPNLSSLRKVEKATVMPNSHFSGQLISRQALIADYFLMWVAHLLHLLLLLTYLVVLYFPICILSWNKDHTLFWVKNAFWSFWIVYIEKDHEVQMTCGDPLILLKSCISVSKCEGKSVYWPKERYRWPVWDQTSLNKVFLWKYHRTNYLKKKVVQLFLGKITWVSYTELKALTTDGVRCSSG